MFNDDELQSALNKMYDYSPVDGFIDISDGLGNMIKSLANEPSVGLFYVQQHTHKAVPNLVNLKNNIVSKSHEISLHTQDSEDSITMLKSMKECGFPIVDDMVKDITKSLAIMSSKQPKKGLIGGKAVSGSQTGSWGVNDNYLSSVFKSAKQKATNLKWAPQGELRIPDDVLTGNEEKGVLVDELIVDLERSENFDEFKAVKEARFEEWLSGDDTREEQ